MECGTDMKILDNQVHAGLSRAKITAIFYHITKTYYFMEFKKSERWNEQRLSSTFIKTWKNQYQ